MNNPEQTPGNNPENSISRRTIVTGIGLYMTAAGLFFAYVGDRNVNEYDDMPREELITLESDGKDFVRDAGGLHDRGETLRLYSGILATVGASVTVTSRVAFRKPKRPNLYIVR